MQQMLIVIRSVWNLYLSMQKTNLNLTHIISMNKIGFLN